MASDRNGNPVPASSIRIFSNSQSVLQLVQSWKASTYQEIVAEIIKKLQRTNVTLHWILGHSEIKGNERAYKLAKTAIEKNSDQPPQRNGILWYLIRLALKKADIRAEMSQLRKKETGKFTKKIDAALHLSKLAELYQQLDSTEAAILAQLRTGKSFLKEYLYKIKASETVTVRALSAGRQRQALRRAHNDIDTDAQAPGGEGALTTKPTPALKPRRQEPMRQHIRRSTTYHRHDNGDGRKAYRTL